MARARDTLFTQLMRQGAADFFSSLIGVGRFLGQAFRATAQRFFGRSENLSPPQTRALNRVAKIAQAMPITAREAATMSRRDRMKAVPTKYDQTIQSNYFYIFNVTVSCPGQPDQVGERVIGNPYKMSLANLQAIVSRDRANLWKATTPDKPDISEDCTLTVTSVRGAYSRNP